LIRNGNPTSPIPPQVAGHSTTRAGHAVADEENVMKCSVAIVLVALLLLPFAGGVQAQEGQWLRQPYRFTVAADGGFGMPLGPDVFNELWNSALPFSAAIGYVVIPYIEVRGWVTWSLWTISENPAKAAIDVQGVQGISGGSITTLLYGGSVKVIPFPNSQVMPFVEVGGGAYRATASDLELEDVLTNEMEDANGPVLLTSGGLDYGINDSWNVYAKFNYYMSFDENFAPGDLVRGPSDPPTEGGSLQFSSIVLGLTLKI